VPYLVANDLPDQPAGVRFRSQMLSKKILQLPGTHNGLAAAQAGRAGFEACYLSGAAMTASMGLPDLGVITVDEVAFFIRQVVRASGLPVLVDGDTGYGEALNVMHMVRTFEDAGAAAVHLEDQLLPKGTRVIAELLRIAPDVKFIVQSSAANEEQTVELFRHGIRGIISRSISPDLLVRCVRRIAIGETWIDNQALNWVIEAYRVQGAALLNPRTQMHLSPKEKAIITCITRGLRNKEIAYEMQTSEQVIKNYLRKIFDKLGVEDRVELALFSMQNKMIMEGSDQVAAVQRALSR